MNDEGEVRHGVTPTSRVGTKAEEVSVRALERGEKVETEKTIVVGEIMDEKAESNDNVVAENARRARTS